jgi:two-component system, chemotaxis family, sensor kinase CheA
MSQIERVESLAKAVATTDQNDPKGLVDIRDGLSLLKEELTDDAPSALAEACERALDSLTALLWQEADDPEETYGFIQAVAGYAQEVIQALESGGSADSISPPRREGDEAPTDSPPPGEGVDRELLTMFVSGCQEGLEELEGQLLRLEQEGKDEELLASIRRRIHTIKGECGVLALAEAQRLCHTAEDLIDEYTDRGQPLPGDTLLHLVDWLNRYVSALGEDSSAPPPDSGALAAELAAASPDAVETTDAIDAADTADDSDEPNEPAVEAEAPREDSAPASVEIDRTQRVVFDQETLEDPMVPDILTEGRQHLDDAEGALLEMEDRPEDSELVDRIFRAFHTIKGVAGFMNLEMIVAVAHKSETLLDDFRKGVQKCTPDHLNLIFQSRDIMGQLLGVLVGEPAPLLCEVTELLDHLAAAKGGGTEEKASSSGYQALGPTKEAPSPNEVPETKAEPDDVASEVPAARDEIPKPSASAPIPSPAASSAGADPIKPQAAPPGKRGGAQKIEQTVKVGTLRLDSLVDMVGELVIAQQMIIQDPVVAAINAERVNRNLGHVAKITRDLQEAAMSLRMVPLRTTFQKMARLVRDVSRKAGKKVTLTIHGEDTELDRTVVEEIGDPLVHLIRNAVDHGLETSEERLEVGKSASGQLELRAYHQGGSIVIEIIDDGRGLNRERIIAKGLERGLIPPETNPDEIPDGDVWKMIFKPGFSTAEKVTDISGRGVGMDVVRRNIESMRGKIDITSSVGKGSVFTLRLPLTLAIIDGMIVRVGDSRYVVPTLSIEQSFRPTPEQLHTVFEEGEMVKVRGRLFPVRKLKEVFGLDAGEEDPCQAILLLLEVADQRICLLVDEILGQHQVVIKSLGKGLPKVEGVSGGAILGDGRVALIIDVDSLVDDAVRTAV